MSVVSDLCVAFGLPRRIDLARKFCVSPSTLTDWDRDGMPAWAVLVARDLLENAGIDPPASLADEHRRVVETRLARP